VILDDELKGAVTRDYRSFFRSEEVYKNLHVPWKRGLIFLGVSVLRRLSGVWRLMGEVASWEWQDDQCQGHHEGGQGASALCEIVS